MIKKQQQSRGTKRGNCDNIKITVKKRINPRKIIYSLLLPCVCECAMLFSCKVIKSISTEAHQLLSCIFLIEGIFQSSNALAMLKKSVKCDEKFTRFKFIYGLKKRKVYKVLNFLNNRKTCSPYALECVESIFEL